jgi:xanthine dehydrogenase accessory factor
VTGSVFAALRVALGEDRPVALATVVDGINLGAKLLVEPAATPLGTLGDPDLDRVVARDALGELAAARSGIRHYGPQGQANQTDLAVFVESHAPPPRMVIFGAVDFTAALCRVAKVLGYHVTVCDARAVFATWARFPHADEVVVDWPQRVLDELGHLLGPSDAVCVLTHDPKFDVPAIQGALATEVGYLGVMGSRSTHDRRLVRLAEEGVDDQAELARIRAPIGLDLGGRTPEETAVAICAEIITARTGHDGRPLHTATGPIHT